MPSRPPTTETLPHRQLHGLLVELGFIVEDERRFGRYSVDCYVAELHLAFEADGEDFHRGRARARDNDRDMWLMERAGLPVLRLADRELSSDKARQQAAWKVRDFVDLHAGSLAERLNRGRWWL